MALEKIQFDKIAESIINEDKYKSLINEKHHGISRYKHLMHVSKITYYISRFFRMDYVSATRGALLHDYFNDYEYGDTRGLNKGSIHPTLALNNASKSFKLNDVEKNIILSHMYPMGNTKPKYKESVLVSLMDDVASIYECSLFKPREVIMTWLLFIINIM